MSTNTPSKATERRDRSHWGESPWTDLAPWATRMQDLMEQMWSPAMAASDFAPGGELRETDEAFTLELDLPGVEQEGHHDRVLRPAAQRARHEDDGEGGQGTLRHTTRASGSFTYEAILPVAVDEKAVTASLAGRRAPRDDAQGHRGQDDAHRDQLIAMAATASTMHAIVYHGPGQKAWEEVPKPALTADTDAIVKVDTVTICGTDLHILKGDVAAVTDGRILGHEAVGTVEAGRRRRQERQGRRPRARLVHHRVRCLPLLPRRQLRPVHRRRRLDPRPQDRRHPGRVRPGAVRGHLDVSRPRRCHRRGSTHARRHPAHGLRGRRAERPGPARRRRRRRGRRPGRARPPSWVPGSSARRTSWPSTWPMPRSRRPSSSVPTSR